jgi:uncharacterized protein YegL
MDTPLPAALEADPDGPDWGEELFATSREFASNPDPRCPCVLLLDNSSSMAGAPLASLNEGLRTLREELSKDPLARQRVEVAVVTFGSPVHVVQPFVTVERFLPPTLCPQGQTPLGTGVLQGLDLLEARKAQYRAHGIAYSRPWLLLVTDGMPKGESWQVTRQAVERLRASEAAAKVAVFAVGVEGANMNFLARLCRRPPLALSRLRFAELFTWLSASAARAAHAPVDDQLEFPPFDEATL